MIDSAFYEEYFGLVLMRNMVRKFTSYRLSLEQIGWFSTALFLMAYFLASTGVIGAESLLYQSLNIIGAIGYSFYAHKKRVYPSLFANLIWALVGIYAVAAILL